MKYLTISSPADPHLSFVQELYSNAFPQEERRDWTQLVSMLGKVSEMRLQLIADADTQVGFIISWLLSDWCFIEHFAISEGQRGKKYGETVIRDFTAGNKVLLEIEPPLTADAIRRLNFYERAGMNCLLFPYQQPSYRERNIFYPMEIMSNVIGLQKAEIDEILNDILEKVYCRYRM